MVTNIRCKEVCHGCLNNILKHNLIVICRKCQKNCHAKCDRKFYNYDFIDESWPCWECNSVEECRYNPFKSYRYDKYSQPDSNSLIAFQKFIKLKIYLKIVIDMTYVN